MTRRRLIGLAAVFLFVVALLLLVSFAPPDQKDFGRYRVVKVTGILRNVPIVSLVFEGTSDLFCPPRQELYFERIHLATCETPSGSWNGPPQPIPDPFCFAIAPDGSSASYWHESDHCAVGTGPRKTAGVYFHSAAEGERRLYRRSGEGVSLMWGGEPSAGGIKIGLRVPEGPDERRTMPRGGIRVVGPDGVERVDVSVVGPDGVRRREIRSAEPGTDHR
ncbi:MAG TPA: hypothetical protein VFO67_08130 [Gemmatimonadales bacterium]|nr:hypothetical protein [Gemmatimonadales bacterium]